MKLLIILLLIYSAQTFAQSTFRFGFTGSLLSKSLTGTDNSIDEEGKFISNTNFHYGINTAYVINPGFHFLLNYINRSYDFDTTNEIIAGEEAFVLTRTEAGVRWMVHPRVGFRLLANFDEELVFQVNSNSQAEIYSEKINYLSLYYDQILFLGGSMYSGFKLGYDVNATGETITARSATKYGVFAVLNALEVSYEVINTTKETDNLIFTDTESAVQFTYMFKF